MVLQNSPSDHETWSIGYHVDFTSILHSQFHIHILHWSLKRSVWSELGPAPSFPPMRVLEEQWSRALSLVCEVALRDFLRLKSWEPGTHVNQQALRRIFSLHIECFYYSVTCTCIACNSRTDFTYTASIPGKVINLWSSQASTLYLSSWLDSPRLTVRTWWDHESDEETSWWLCLIGENRQLWVTDEPAEFEK